MTDILRPPATRAPREPKPSIGVPRIKSKSPKNGNGEHPLTAVSAPSREQSKPPSPTRPRAAAEDEQLDRRELLTALTALKKGDFSVRLPMGLDGLDGKLADAFNDVIELNQRMSQEFERLSRVVGKEGRISERASIGHVQGSWANNISAVNALMSD